MSKSRSIIPANRSRLADPIDPVQLPTQHIDTRTRETMGYPVVVEATLIGVAFNPFDQRDYRVMATRHDKIWPGTDSDLTFAVERLKKPTPGRTSWENGPDMAWGFFSEELCFQFLNMCGWMELEYPDPNGNMVRDRRHGLCTPDPYIRRDVAGLFDLTPSGAVGIVDTNGAVIA